MGVKVSAKTTFPPATDKQKRFIVALCRRLRMPNGMRDDWIVSRYGKRLDDLAIGEASEIIDTLNGWEDIPPHIRRASGQRDLF